LPLLPTVERGTCAFEHVGQEDAQWRGVRRNLVDCLENSRDHGNAIDQVGRREPENCELERGPNLAAEMAEIDPRRSRGVIRPA
jgi:hypothetical protein